MNQKDTSPTAGASEPTRTVPQEPAGPRASTHPDIGKRIGSYTILDVLGEGGMGVVYLAEQDKPRRQVALKVIRPGLASDRLLRRFEHEAQILGQLHHPAIAQVHEAGTADTGSGPQPYFAMEVIKGLPLTEYAQSHRLGARARLELLAGLCDGIQHAHQRGVIHRDLKPGNILVTDEGQPKILDFGVARAIDSDIQATTLHTDVGQLIGTIPYMSPEQAAGDPAKVDTRSDVYSLGVVAYELLAGRLPYDVQGKLVHEAVRVIREVEPTPLSSANRFFRGDIETIIAKALEKDKSRRYQSAGELARDIEHHLANEPVVARPPSAFYQLSKFAKRNKGLVGGMAAVFIVLVLGVIGTSIGMSRAFVARDAEAEQRRLAEDARREAQLNLSLAEHREKEAIEARDQLQIVVDFQASMLSEIDPEQMGLGLLTYLREGIREAMATRNVSPEEIDQTIGSFDASVRGVNVTDVALEMVDKHVLSRAVATIERDFADQPLVRAALQQTVASTYSKMGRYAPAMALQEAALRTRRAELGDDHADTLTSISAMGQLLMEMGKLEEAMPYLCEALEGNRRLLGDDHPDTLNSINNVGMLLKRVGKLDEAEPYLREALEGSRRVLGDDDPSTLTSIGNMGGLLESMGKLEEALGYHREALEGSRRVLGDDHPQTLISANNVGYLLKSMGKLDEAEPYYREALEGCRRTLGDDHPTTLVLTNNMGTLLQSMGRLEEALGYFRKALEGRRRLLGDDHPDTLISMNNIGQLLLDLGRLEEAEALGAEAVRGARRSLPEGHWYVGVFLGGYGKTLTAMKRYADAETALLEAHGVLEAALGTDHERTVTVIQLLADLYDAWHAAEPGKGYDAKAAEWRAKLRQWQATTQPATTQPGA